MNDIMAIIKLYENEDEIKSLTANRSLGALPYGGRYRLIDFPLSNMVNSDINNVGIFAYNNTRSLVKHIGSGEVWDLNRKKDGLFIFYPSNSRGNILKNQEMESFRDNLEYLLASSQEYVVITTSYMVFAYDFSKTVEFHKKNNCDVTILYKNIDDGKENFVKCDTLILDNEDNVITFGINGGGQDNQTISLETYVMRRDFLIDLIKESSVIGSFYSLRDLIMIFCSQYKVKGHEFKGYAQCINSVNSYFKNSLDLLNENISSNLFNEELPIHTRTKDNAPTKYGKNAHVKNSVIANGAIIEGTVENCIISRGVKVEKGAVVKNSILLTKSYVGENINVEYVIADKRSSMMVTKNIQGSEDSPIIIEKNSVV
ncbi:glucose-1-phosphate adenylyltransferase subunit GlgD [Clostridium cellulovorans]|uniref:Glucose-1-phosphate adenylyltransferase, GlgD subunit n=1 Tax=Clostridium cellulovorans (strain ATCC 35296 / DSM 3052 / OCM 3 / 743B) TaxID=573061 RepID=D9SSS4_CLOC7|nr:glucose-1-phosphate adenylyltransferase subunit GlgD [Clostridium cellulovorans]ADL52586.1 glucose-1-phosphate adenylyltransferase, GlgD subunit [Clostridium cellulovorans 743B]